MKKRKFIIKVLNRLIIVLIILAIMLAITKKHLPTWVNVTRKKLGRHSVTECSLYLYCITFL